MAAFSKRKEVRPALAELEAPVLDNENDEGVAPSSAAAASSSSSSSATRAASLDSKPPAPAKKKARKQRISQQQHGPSWLVTLLTQHADCASVVLDFLWGENALRGIGTTALALRAGAKALLPRLALMMNPHNGFPSARWLKSFGRLQHLTIANDGWAKGQHEQLAANIAEAGLSARLQTFGYTADDCLNPIYAPLLANHAWPQLRSLNWEHMLVDFLDAVLERPAAVFPQLETFDFKLYGIHAGKLLTLLDRGAFPSLTSSHGSGGSSLMARGSATGLAQQIELLHRLPAIEDLGLGADVVPFAELISSSGLPNLQCVRDCLDVHLFLDTTRHVI